MLYLSDERVFDECSDNELHCKITYNYILQEKINGLTVSISCRTIKLNPANRLLVDDLERSSSTSGSNRLLTSGRSLSDQLSIKSDASLSESNHVDDRSRVLPAADDPVHTLRVWERCQQLLGMTQLISLSLHNSQLGLKAPWWSNRDQDRCL